MVVPVHLVADPYILAGIPFAAISILAVLGRFYVRAYLLRAWGHDDTACLVTLILACGYYSAILVLWRVSGLQAVSDVPAENIEPSVNLVLASLLSYIMATMALKVALGLLLLRVLVKRAMRIVIYVTLAISVSCGLAYFFRVLFQCGDPAKFWLRILTRKCLANSTVDGMAYSHAALTSLADIVFAALPIVYLWNAPLARRVKLSVGGILALGSAGCIASLVRLGWVSNLTSATNTFAITSRGIALMSAIELAIGLTCISLSTYKPLLNRHFFRQATYRSFADEEHQAKGNPVAMGGVVTPATPGPDSALVKDPTNPPALTFFQRYFGKHRAPEPQVEEIVVEHKQQYEEQPSRQRKGSHALKPVSAPARTHLGPKSPYPSALSSMTPASDRQEQYPIGTATYYKT